MYAVEFETKLKNGSITIPEDYRNSLTGQVKVIILKDEPASVVWPSDIIAFKGVDDVPAFESYRDDLLQSPADPLA